MTKKEIAQKYTTEKHYVLGEDMFATRIVNYITKEFYSFGSIVFDYPDFNYRNERPESGEMEVILCEGISGYVNVGDIYSVKKVLERYVVNYYRIKYEAYWHGNQTRYDVKVVEKVRFGSLDDIQ